MIASHRFPMYRPKDGLCDIQYLVHYFKSKRGKSFLALASPGGAGRNKTLGQKEFSKLAILMPSAAEQRRIAALLSTWDQAIDLSMKLLANVSAQKKSLMEHLLTGKRRLPGFEGAWSTQQIGNLLHSLSAGVSVNSSDQDVDDTQPSVLKTSCISGGRFLASERKRVDDQKEVGRLRQPLENQSLLISRMNTPALVGMCAYVDVAPSNTFLPDRLWQVAVKPSVDIRWLSYLLQSPAVKLKVSAAASGTSSSMKNLSKRGLQSIRVVVPCHEEQKAIADVLALNDLLLDRFTSDLSRLRRERRALMQRLLTGMCSVTRHSAA